MAHRGASYPRAGMRPAVGIDGEESRSALSSPRAAPSKTKEMDSERERETRAKVNYRQEPGSINDPSAGIKSLRLAAASSSHLGRAAITVICNRLKMSLQLWMDSVPWRWPGRLTRETVVSGGDCARPLECISYSHLPSSDVVFVVVCSSWLMPGERLPSQRPISESAQVESWPATTLQSSG